MHMKLRLPKAMATAPKPVTLNPCKLVIMSKYLGCLNDTKISIPLKLYHKIDSLGG
jgi:hypothetical protein